MLSANAESIGELFANHSLREVAEGHLRRWGIFTNPEDPPLAIKVSIKADQQLYVSL